MAQLGNGKEIGARTHLFDPRFDYLDVVHRIIALGDNSILLKSAKSRQLKMGDMLNSWCKPTRLPFLIVQGLLTI
jgi:hypothetical protein